MQFFFFAAVNIISAVLTWLYVPETKGVSLEEMDVVFGAVTREERDAFIAARAQELHVNEKNIDADHIERAGSKA